MTLVKLGGSAVKSPSLNRWVAAIEQAIEPIVVIPGGGPFADTVRKHQARLEYDDATAHEMAILSMEQFGCVLLNLSNRFVAADSFEALDAALKADRIPVWRPWSMAMRAAEIPQDWSVTSDSLAAWLQYQLRAERLCMIKLIDVPADSTVDALSRAGVVDNHFPRMVWTEGELYVAGPKDLAAAGRRFAVGDVPGQRIPTSGRTFAGSDQTRIAAE